MQGGNLFWNGPVTQMLRHFLYYVPTLEQLVPWSSVMKRKLVEAIFCGEHFFFFLLGLQTILRLYRKHCKIHIFLFHTVWRGPWNSCRLRQTPRKLLQMKLWTFSKLAHQHITMKRNREMLQQSSEKVTRGKNVFLFSHQRDTKVPAWPETPTSLPRLPLSGNAQTSRRHVWRSPPPCLCMSADSLILSLHDSSVSWVCQPPALVSLPSLNPNCFGKRCCRWEAKHQQ